MDAATPVAVRTQYRSRPGRRAIEVTDLASLAGPVSGPVELPLRLFWGSPDRTFDLGNPFIRRWLYQTVLREASRPEDVTRYLDAWHAYRRVAGPASARRCAPGLGRTPPGAAGCGCEAGLMPVSELHARVVSAALW